MVKKNNLVKTFSKWGPDFAIQFEFKILKRPAEWHSVLHLTTGENCCNKGSRIPGIFLNSDGQGTYMYLTIAMTGKEKTKKYWLDLNKWLSMELNQKNGQFSVVLDFFWQTRLLKRSSRVSFIPVHIAQDFKGTCIKSSCGEKLYVFAMPHMGY